MSDRNNQRNPSELAVIIGAVGVAAIVGVTAAAVATAQENEPTRRGSGESDNDEDSPAINWGRVFGTFGSVARAVLANITDDELMERPSLPSSQQQKICGICSQAIMWESKELSCKHRFHRGCIRMWKETNRTCPTCYVLL